MKTDKEIEEIFDKADKEMQEICSKYNLTIEADMKPIFFNHHQRHDNGDWSIRARSISFAPF